MVTVSAMVEHDGGVGEEHNDQSRGSSTVEGSKFEGCARCWSKAVAQVGGRRRGREEIDGVGAVEGRRSTGRRWVGGRLKMLCGCGREKRD
ncbi:hypothetical protein R6Q57_002246 [Mikania cordata]